MSAKKEFKITLGADPEFAFLDEEARLVVYPKAVRTVRNYSGPEYIGVDGAGRVAELRPDPSESSTKVVSNLKTLLQKGLEVRPYLTELFWKAGGYAVTEPLGGHIHIGHSDDIRGTVKYRSYCGKLGKILSSTVGIISLFLENQKEAIFRRNSSGYGRFYGEDSVRDQPWGMEWRSLSSWLTSPEVAQGMLSGTKLIALACQPDSKELEAGLKLKAPGEDLVSSCNSADLIPYLKNALEFLTSLPKWGECKHKIVPLLRLIKEGKDWGSEVNMIEAWNLEVPSSV